MGRLEVGEGHSGAQQGQHRSRGAGGGRLCDVRREGHRPWHFDPGPGREGVLLGADEIERTEPWLDHLRSYATAGVLYLLTGLPGWPVWLVPRETDLDGHLVKARAFSKGGCIVQLDELEPRLAEILDENLQAGAPPKPEAMAALARYIEPGRSAR